eukprot:5162232-Pyramimonas_sp.AAC.1
MAATGVARTADVFLLKMNAVGSELAAFQLGGRGADVATGLAPSHHDQSSLYVCGHFAYSPGDGPATFGAPLILTFVGWYHAPHHEQQLN